MPQIRTLRTRMFDLQSFQVAIMKLASTILTIALIQSVCGTLIMAPTHRERKQHGSVISLLAGKREPNAFFNEYFASLGLLCFNRESFRDHGKNYSAHNQRRNSVLYESFYRYAASGLLHANIYDHVVLLGAG